MAALCGMEGSVSSYLGEGGWRLFLLQSGDASGWVVEVAWYSTKYPRPTDRRSPAKLPCHAVRILLLSGYYRLPETCATGTRGSRSTNAFIGAWKDHEMRQPGCSICHILHLAEMKLVVFLARRRGVGGRKTGGWTMLCFPGYTPSTIRCEPCSSRDAGISVSSPMFKNLTGRHVGEICKWWLHAWMRLEEVGPSPPG